MLAGHLDGLRFALSGSGGDDLRTERDRVVRLLRGVVARTAEPRAPLLVVVGGGSGAGKSTTVNSLAGATLTQVGVVRPTTRTPTLVCHPDDRAWFADDRVLPDLVRLGPDADAGAGSGGRALRLVTSDRLRAGLALLDTPDIDSVEVANHHVADLALDAADVWLWLATARTYADEIGMTYLQRARRREVLTAVAVTQVRDADAAEVLGDVDRLLTDHGVSPDRRLAVPFVEVVEGRLTGEAATPLRGWLEELAPTDVRVEVRRRALAGVRAAIPDELAPVAAALEDEERTVRRLLASVAAPYDELPRRLERELDVGLSLRGEVLDRWQRSVGGGEQLRRVQSAADQLQQLVRDRLGRGTPEQQVQVEAVSELSRLLDELLDHAHRQARAGLEADPIGRELLDAAPDTRRAPAGREGRIREALAAWEDELGRLIEEVGAPRKAQARRRTTAINAVATSAILVLFTVSGGLTGGEVGIAAGAAATSQWVLVKLFGEQNLRDLLASLRADLDRRVEDLAATERRVLAATVAGAAPAPADVDAVRAAREAPS